MESKFFSIGDIVTLKSHPYVSENTSIIVSGDHLTLPPLMVVTEISKSTFKADEKKVDTFRYECIWFSPKTFKFETADVYEDQLKLIKKSALAIDPKSIERGARLNFKTVSLELGKKKSTLSYDDNSVNGGAPNTTINTLLAFLPPVLQFVGNVPYKSKHPLNDKGKVIRLIPVTAVVVNYFDTINNCISEYPLPVEVLELIEKIPDKRLVEIQKIIQKSGYLMVGNSLKKTLIQPKNISHKGGYYYLRGFNYLTNRMEEYNLKASTSVRSVTTPFTEEAPKFDILTQPEAATSKFITNEIQVLLNKAITQKSYIRIKYLNKNNQLTQRTIKNMQLVTIKEDAKDVAYMIGFCLLRSDKRNFRVDRIQNAQCLALTYR
ncbi:WYL domain-containing protein [Mucilaginibacter arboris]|nr:WYL domain-containing protein [Mucilaginibacter arboris]